LVAVTGFKIDMDAVNDGFLSPLVGLSVLVGSVKLPCTALILLG